MKEGSSLLHYRILSRLGEGGMGVVYRAEDTRLGRQVALKVLREDLAEDREWNRRFQHEVRAASAVTHPGIATVYDFHHDGDTAFFTMEFVEGRNLRDILKDGPLPIPHLIDAALQMADAVAEAHRKGVIHRDLKPENVMASDSGFYKILDFGLARLEISGDDTGSGSQLKTVSADTTGGRLVGTVAYMSPEQAQGLAVDSRSDIFTFGSLLHELATGQAAFRRKNAIATFHAIVHEEPDPIGSIRPDAPEGLGRIVSRCLAKDPARRYQTSADLQRDLRALAQDSGSGVRRIPWTAPAQPAPSGRRRLMWAAAATAVVVAAGLIALLGPGRAGPTAGGARPTAGGAASAQAPPLAEPAATPLSTDTVAVSAFANNSGAAEAEWMSRGLAEMLTTELAGMGRFKVISTQRLDDLLSMAGRTDLGAAEGATVTELARWAGAGVVITGSIVRAEGGYRVDAQAYDTTTGQVLAATKAEGADVAAMPARLAAALSAGLGVTEQAARVPGAMVAVNLSTGSSEASRRYARGMGLYDDLRFDEAAREFRRAVEVDPGFALARMRLGMSLYLQGRKTEGLEAIGQVAAGGEGVVPEREHRLVTILDGTFRAGDPKAAARALDDYVKRYPADLEGLFWKAQAAADLAGDRVGAIRVLRSILEQEPDSLTAVSAMSMHLAELGHADDAKRILEDYLLRHPEAAGPLKTLIKSCEMPPG